jgi:transcription initiation factor TFIIH subunit 2
VLIIYGALLSSDPGDIRDTISNLLSDRIRVSIVGLAAQVAICAELCSRTNGGDPSAYSVALHEQHFRELFLAATTPPATHSSPDQPDNQAALLMMGFPSRTLASHDHISFCACHHRATREGYACTRCKAKVCRLPAECPICGLTLVLSTHLARSYHHLFPLKGWVEVPWSEATKSVACYSCLTPFSPVPAAKGGKQGGKGRAGEEDGTRNRESRKGVGVAPPAVVREANTAGVSESGRYACQVCGNHFCINCDVFAHEVIHNCPGCQSDIRGTAGGDAAQGNGEAVMDKHNGTSEAMALD